MATTKVTITLDEETGRCMSGAILDVGGLIALDRNDRRVITARLVVI